MPSQLHARWTLDPAVRFLNHGSFGGCPREVLAAQAELRARMEREPVLFLARELQGLLDQVRAELAPFVGAEPQDLAFVPNATTAVNAILRSLELSPSDELLITDQGYGACSNALRYAAERAGSRVGVAAIPFPLTTPDTVLERVLAALTPRTRLALVDHITSPTGLVLPIERLVSAIRERGVAVLVDGAHAPGMVPLSISALGCDYYTGNLHKWVCAPKGAAFLWVRRELQPTVRPVVISHGASARLDGRSRYQVEFDWVGTDDPTAVLSVPVALRTMGTLFPGGWDELRRRNRELALQARKLLCATLDLDPPSPDEMIGSLAAVPLPDTDPAVAPSELDPLHRALFERHRIEVPVMPWPSPPKRLLRIAAQAYNDLDDYRALCDALAAELGR